MDENFPVTLTLNVRTINTVLLALAELPLKQSVDAWLTIKNQTQVVIDAAAIKPGPVAPAETPVSTPEAPSTEPPASE